jgi:sortase A
MLNAWRISERCLLALGLMMLTGFGAGMIHRHAGSSAAISEFEASHPDLRPETAAPIDFSLWSGKRIKAFQHSLALIKDEPLAVLSIARLQIKAPVFPGTGELVLNRGAGWILGTAKPGEAGNSGIAGHRDGFFRALKDVQVGDIVALRTSQARSAFRVDEIEIVSPADVRVLRQRPRPSLTLVTCYPFYFVGDAPQRFVVHASLEKQETTNPVRNSGAATGMAASTTHKEQLNEQQ